MEAIVLLASQKYGGGLLFTNWFAGARRGVLNLPGVEEDVGLIGIHWRGRFIELVPWNGLVRCTPATLLHASWGRINIVHDVCISGCPSVSMGSSISAMRTHRRCGGMQCSGVAGASLRAPMPV